MISQTWVILNLTEIPKTHKHFLSTSNLSIIMRNCLDGNTFPAGERPCSILKCAETDHWHALDNWAGKKEFGRQTKHKERFLGKIVLHPLIIEILGYFWMPIVHIHFGSIPASITDIPWIIEQVKCSSKGGGKQNTKTSSWHMII